MDAFRAEMRSEFAALVQPISSKSTAGLPLSERISVVEKRS